MSTPSSASSPALFGTVLVMLGLDHRDHSVLDALVTNQQRFAFSKVVVCHVSNRDPLGAPLLGLAPKAPEADVGPPAELLAAAARLQDELPEGTSVVTEHLVGPPEAVLVEAVERHDVDLVAMGRNPSVDGQPGWGSSRRKLLRLTTCSVLVVPHGAVLDLSRVVCGMDFSQLARLALGVSCRLADGVDAVYQYDPQAVVEAGRRQEEFRQQVSANARRILEAEVIPSVGDGSCRPNLIVHPGGKVAEVLIRYAGQQPIVMGSRGLTPLAQLLLGSSADRVAGRAQGPVLIMRKKGSVLGLLERLVHKA